MPPELFRTLTDRSARRPTRAPLVWPVSLVVHALALGAVVVIPLAATDVLPQPRLLMAAFEQPSPPPPPPAAPVARPSTPARQMVAVGAAPVTAPGTIGQEDALERVPAGSVADLVSSGGVVPGGVEGGLPLTPAAAPPVVAKPVAPYPVGGDVQRPEKIRHVPPIYPPLAREARVQGIVILEAIISETGDVRDVRVLKGVPLLNQAAIDAVREWRFTPTLLNGVPVPVVFTVTVQFRLQ